MEGALPDIINRRKDEFGHSVPLKIWLRRHGPLSAWVTSVLAPEIVRQRGIFRREAVSRMLDEHRRHRHNHAHRLWSVLVLQS